MSDFQTSVNINKKLNVTEKYLIATKKRPKKKQVQQSKSSEELPVRVCEITNEKKKKGLCDG